MKKSPLKRGTKPLKRTALRKRGKSDLAKLKEELWQLCRKLIKKLYPHKCYTCGKQLIDGTQDFHIGHFISSSICSTALRYDLDNLRPQCSGCNVWKSGNWLNFEQHLKQEKGDDFVDELKQRNYTTKGLAYKSDWYEKKIEEYTKDLSTQ